MLALAFLLSCGANEPKVRNLVLVSIDTLVPGRMSVYGGPRPTTPAIEDLATKGVRFDHAFSPAPWTLPAHAAMLTGRYPSSLAADPGDRRLYQLAPMLAQRFQEAGFRTGAVVGGGYVSSTFGIDRGFDEVREPDAEVGIGRNAKRGARNAIAWIEALGDEPFFLFYHTYVAHEPYRDRRFLESDLDDRLKRFNVTDLCCKSNPLNDQQIEQMLAVYDGGVAAADEFVAGILAALSRAGLRDTTAIIITSDHGQEFWSHTDRGGHSHTLYGNQLEVPLIWYEPGLTPTARIVQEHVSLIDIVPTLVARFGLATKDRFDGFDISPLLEGREWEVERAHFGEAVENGPKRFSVSTERAKLIETPEPDVNYGDLGRRFPVPVRASTELYLAEDADESRNVASEPGHAALIEEHRKLLNAHRRDRSTQHSERPNLEIDEATERQLRELGYVEQAD